MKIVLARNQYEVGTKCIGERGMDWLPDGFWSEEDAKRKGIAVLRDKLRTAGKLHR